MRLLLAALVIGGCAPMATHDTLAGTSWQLVRFQGGDGTTLTPDEKAKYTVAFGADGAVSVRFDCNRGRGTWKSTGKNQLEFGGPMALTRAMCPPGSLHDHLVKQWPYVRSYVIKDGPAFPLPDGRRRHLRARAAALVRRRIGLWSNTARCLAGAGSPVRQQCW